MRTVIYSSLMLILFTASFTARADGYFRLGGMYMKSSNESGGSTSETTRTLIDLGGGYVWPQGWTLGALYGMDNTKSDDAKVERTSWGPTIGWITRSESGVYVLATYFYSSERTEKLEGDGYQIDLGYKFNVSSVDLGIQMSYKHFEYDESNGESLSPSEIDGKIDPYIVLLVQF